MIFKSHDYFGIFILSLVPPLLSTTLLLTVTNITITMTWTPPSFAPPALNDYLGSYNCQRLCKQTLGKPKVSNSQISSPYTITGVDPGSYCVVNLTGIYGDHQISLATTTAYTLSSGNIYIYIYIYIHLHTFSISCINNYYVVFMYLQHPMHLSVVSLFCLLMQGP